MSGPRFVLKDRARDRPTVPAVRAMVAAYYALPGNGAGGNCHVVLDDGNRGDQFLILVIADCEREGDHDGKAIMEAMLKMTPTQRRKVGP